MKFSIVIPVYNVEKYLRKCLESVVNQTFTDYEVICVNDGSTDKSLEIAEQFSIFNFQFSIISQENAGLSAARNAGIRAAQGDYIFLLDSDDCLVPNALEILSKNIENQDFIAFGGERFFENGFKEKADIGITETKMSGWDYYNKYALVPRKFHFVCTVLRLYKREFLLKNKLFFEAGIYHEDNLYTPLVCYYAENVRVIPDVLYVYRIREGSITQNVNLQAVLQRQKDTIQIINKLTDFFENKNIDKKILYRQNSMWILNAFNILFSYRLTEKMPEILSKLSEKFQKTIVDFDMKFLFHLIKKKKITSFNKLYRLDFLIIRNYWRKIKKRVKK
ncbi:hypothetical protein FACS1894180_5370 [Bacteroidia bacterium]|nr:hypothetical protein FACS1894180_5370 [Bacteroidia bacterium]